MPDQNNATTPPLEAGAQYMVKHPSVGGQWQIAQTVTDEGNEGIILIEFADGTRYQPESVEIGARMDSGNALTPTSAEDQPDSARVSPLNPEYEAFRKLVTEINGQSKRLFQLPLAVLLTMASRLATQQESAGSGHMGNYDGIQLFVPDQATFDVWLEDYLYEIQKREAGNSPE